MRTASGYKAVWNPRPSDFADQTTPEEIASGHRAGAPTVTVVQGTPSRPRRRMRVRIPRATPPGIYLLLVHDGSEGGAHTTWDYVQVPGAPVSTEPPNRTRADATGTRPRTLEPVVLLAVAAGLLAALIRTRARKAR